jgi:signal transduction histidine kinase
LGALLIGIPFVLWLRIRIKRELAPLRRLSQDVADFDPLKPHEKLAAVTRSELLPIHKAISDLGSRLERRMANERAFTAHAAHALRTPLAGMDAQLAMAIKESAPEARPRLQKTREAAARLTRVVTALLTLFRSGVDIQWQRQNLASLLERLPVEGLEVRVEEPGFVDADPDLLSAALINLLDNAVRHGATMVNIQCATDGNEQRLTIADNGPGIPREQLAHIQTAIASQDYQGHVGLGLVLADIVARAHGGRLQLQPDTDGFVVMLTFTRQASQL